MEERRLLLAVALSLLVLTAYSLAVRPRPRRRPRRQRRRPPEPRGRRRRATPAPRARPARRRAVGRAEAEAAPVAPAVADERERRVEVVAPDFRWRSRTGERAWCRGRSPGYRDDRGAPGGDGPGPGAGGCGRSTSRPGTPASTRGCATRCSCRRPRRSSCRADGARDAALRVRRRPGRGREDPDLRGDGARLGDGVGDAGRAAAAGAGSSGGRGWATPRPRSARCRATRSRRGVALAAGGVERVAAAKLRAGRAGRSPACAGWASRATYFAALFVAPAGGGDRPRCGP